MASEIFHGVATIVAGTAVQLSATSQKISAILLKAAATNVGDVAAGNPTIDATNAPLWDAGETFSVEINDLSKIYVDGTNSGDLVQWEAIG